MTQIPQLPLGMSLAAYESVTSTNDEAKFLAVKNNASEGTVVWAKEQTAGRGRLTRHWISPPGNLYSSTIFRPSTSLAVAAQIAFLPALAVGEMLELLTPNSNFSFKWPNDVLLNRKKISGILLESGEWANTDSMWLVAGCGINLIHSPTEAQFPSTSIFKETSICIPLEEALSVYSRFLFDWYKRWKKDGFSVVREAWLQKADGIKRDLIVELGGQLLRGYFADLDSRGALKLETKNGVRLIESGDVYFTD